MPRLASLTSSNLTGLSQNRIRDVFEYIVTIVNSNAESSRSDDDFAQNIFSFTANSSLIAVGARVEDITAGTITNNGKVYVYDRQGQLLHTLTNPNEIPFGQQGGELNDNFGSGVWLTEEYLLVLASGEDLSTDTFESNAGRFYLYDVNDLASDTPIASTTATSEGIGGGGVGPLYGNTIYPSSSTQNIYTKLTIPSFTFSTVPTQISRNGFSGFPAVSETYVAVPVGGPSTIRSIEVYDRTTDTLVSTLTAPSGASVSNFVGFDRGVAQNSTLTAVGDSGAKPNGETGDLGGAVWLYNSATGTVAARIDNPSTSTFSGSDNFGRSIVMNDKWLVVNATGEDVFIDGRLREGQVYVYKLSDLSLAYTIQTPTPSDNTTFGRWMQLQSDLLMISESIAERLHVYLLK
jgi:hypothetical protein